MSALDELMKEFSWMPHELCGADEIDDEEEARLLDLLKSAKDEYKNMRVKYERLETIAEDVNEWLKTSANLKGTAHQRELEAALKGE